MYRFVNINDDSSGGADPVAKSINTQTQAINNMGKTINGIAQTVVNLKNLALLQYKEDQKKLREKFKPKYTKQEGNPFKKVLLSIKAYKVKGFLESMLSFLGSLLKIFIIRPILNWLSNPANKKKLSKILESTWKVLKGITEFLGSQFVHAINELHDVLSGETTIWKKITSFTKLWFKFAVGFMAIKFLSDPVKLLRNVARVGNLFERRAKTAKTQLIKRKRFLTGGKWAKGKWLLGGAIGATVLASIAAIWYNQKEKEQQDDSSSPNTSGNGDRASDRAYSIKEYGEDLTSNMYKLMGLEDPNKKDDKKKNMWNPKNWFGGKKEKESKKDGEQPNALGVLAGMYTANEQIKHLFKTFEKESGEFGDKMNEADGAGKAQLLLKLASVLETSLGSKNEMFTKLQLQTQNLVESANAATSGDKTSISEFLKWAGHEIPSREEGGPVGSYENGGKWLRGPDAGYPADHNGQPLIAHGTEGLFTKPGNTSDGFIVPFDNGATQRNPMLTMIRLAQAKKLGFTQGPPGFEGGGGFNLLNPMSWFSGRGKESKADTFFRGAYGDTSVNIQGSGLAAQVGRNRQALNAIMQEMGYATGGPLGIQNFKDNKTYRISQDKGFFEKSNIKSDKGNWFSNFFKGWGGTGGTGGNFGMGVGKTFGTPQAYQEPGSGGLGLVQRLIASHRGDETTSALLARTIFNRKSIIDKTGNPQMFKAKSGSFYDILHAPGQYPNVENGKIKGTFSNSDLNAAGKAMKLAKESIQLKERLQESGMDPAKAQQLLTSTIFKPGSGLNKGGLAALLTGGGGVRYGKYTFTNKPSNAMNSLLGGMNPILLKGLQSVIGNMIGGKKEGMGKDLLMALAGGILGQDGGPGGGGKGGGLMDTLFGMFGLPTKRGGDQKQPGVKGGLGTVLKGIFGGKGGKDKKEERMEAKKLENERNRRIAKFDAAQQKREVQNRIYNTAKEAGLSVSNAVRLNNDKVSQNASQGAQAVARLSQAASQQKASSFAGFFKSLASSLKSKKGK